MVFKTPFEIIYPNSSTASVDDVFNVGIGYVTLKVLKPMVDLDKYEVVAMYGVESMEDYSIPETLKPIRRIEALTRYAFSIKQLISNCVFVFESKRDMVSKALMYDLKLKTDKVERLIPNVYTRLKSPTSSMITYKINEPKFIYILNYLREIKEQLSAPINKAGLIFRQRPNENPTEIVDNFVRKG